MVVAVVMVLRLDGGSEYGGLGMLMLNLRLINWGNERVAT